MRGILELIASANLKVWVEMQPDRGMGMRARQMAVVTAMYSE